MFDVYNKGLKNKSDVILSLSQFFAHNDDDCETDSNGFYQIKCIQGTCSDCNLTKAYKKEDFSEKMMEGLISYNQFCC